MRFILLALCLAATPAFAAPTVSSSSSTSVTGLGFADTSNVTSAQSLSAIFSVNQNWIQTMLSIAKTQGTFVFAAGGAYKFTVHGDRRMGFHIGPGFTVGTAPVTSVTINTTGLTSSTGSNSEFAFSIFGMAGAHYTLFERLFLSVDGGPIVTVIDGDVDFTLKPMGEVLGLSVHYLF